MDAIAPYYKAVTAVLVPFLTAIGAALLPTSDGGSKIMANELITAIVLGLVAGGAVFAVPNKDPQATHQLESVQPPRPEAGVWDTSGLLIALACIVVIIAGLIWIIQNLG